MTTAFRDVSIGQNESVGEDETIIQAALKMSARGVDALPVRGQDNRLRGMLTDRDIVVRVLAAGKDPHRTRVGDVADGLSLALDADDSAARGLQAMLVHQVRRLPVMAGGNVLGVVSRGDLASALGPERVSEFVAA